jgi:hypothetical protein
MEVVYEYNIRRDELHAMSSRNLHSGKQILNVFNNEHNLGAKITSSHYIMSV